MYVTSVCHPRPWLVNNLGGFNDFLFTVLVCLKSEEYYKQAHCERGDEWCSYVETIQTTDQKTGSSHKRGKPNLAHIWKKTDFSS